MKYACLIVFLIVIGCNNSVQPSNSIHDSIALQKPDTAIHNVTNDSEGEFEGVDLKKVKEDWIASYKDTITTDTTFLAGKKEIHLFLKNYCLFDSSLVIPKKYVEFYGMDKFVSNNFATSLLLQVDGNNVIDTIINKSTFENAIIKEDFMYLYDYGALVFNSIEIHNDHVDIIYTIIVPLSDVGSVFKAEVYYNGTVVTKYN
ncbi:hypothetical protein SAMN05428988_5233 [Chitinophaga sp. YR573]|uniref:hypothetical protein n=1 Tax=Chitinophaga sp. YR573 TaxID=1881040 RepID=UPI0008CCCCC8|nr:hypothetical protein [Chitinophaga sp. YR573]SEW40136.1 hypothetical protein SAMN05428988_5233 [Chitinophaga sp. YR573]